MGKPTPAKVYVQVMISKLPKHYYEAEAMEPFYISSGSATAPVINKK